MASSAPSSRPQELWVCGLMNGRSGFLNLYSQGPWRVNHQVSFHILSQALSVPGNQQLSLGDSEHQAGLPWEPLGATGRAGKGDSPGTG
jgi:hypothetical protein